MSLTPEGAGRFRRRLQAWYRRDGRHTLPWRQRRDPYAVLVSEVMLQQTQVERVLPYFAPWMERWPSAAALAEAAQADVLRAWSGLGYNRRALALQEAAKGLPGAGTDVRALRKLAGIGPYTAAAVACFAGGRRVALADTNIARVLARAVVGVPSAPPASAAVAEVSASLLPGHGARDHNLALMDLGALVCRNRTPACDDCPVAGLCAWRAAGYPSGEAHAVTPATRFTDTARWARGRIVERLRTGWADEDELHKLIGAGHAANLGRYLGALERDGLMERVGGRWRLPGDAAPQTTSMASPKL